MRIRVLGAGVYGCHLATALIKAGHEVEVFEKAAHIFAGASGNCPARLHLGATHYPRSGATQEACRRHQPEFLKTYGFLTRNVPICIYAIAETESLVDFAAYRRILDCNDLDYITIFDPAEYGLQRIEGAVLTGERHVVTRLARAHFERELDGHIVYGAPEAVLDDQRWDATIDATWCANSAVGVDRYEPCLTVLIEGPADRSTTIMDGRFSGVYLFDEDQKLSSLTSAELTPFSKLCKTYGEARTLLDGLSHGDLERRASAIMDQMANWWPAVKDLYRVVDFRTAIRAMPASGADSRLVDVAKVGERTIRVRSGKIDAIFEAERAVEELLQCW